MLLRVLPLLIALALWLAPSSQAAVFVAAPPASASPSTSENACTAFLPNESESQIGLLCANDPLDKTDPMGLFDSPEVLRLIVPGQVAYDNAITSAQNGNYGTAAAYGAQMLAEQVLAVATLGASSRAQAGTRAAMQTERAVAGRFAAAAAERQAAIKAGEGIKSALMPGGKLIGEAGSKGVREIEGGLKDAQSMFKQLSQGGKAVENSTYKGTLVELPGGGTVGLREVATRSPGTVATIDVKTPEITVKLKFGQ